ncbi:hypothetical protein Tco_1045815 [Tanacetum coccineum]|uniref:Tf2-1-like SH3-like domain-containing protein n=1 Tax=Tanacetum coccineum TaxID=301880 RepID=A0ABQ5GUP7_9ASTR
MSTTCSVRIHKQTGKARRNPYQLSKDRLRSLCKIDLEEGIGLTIAIRKLFVGLKLGEASNTLGPELIQETSELERRSSRIRSEKDASCVSVFERRVSALHVEAVCGHLIRCYGKGWRSWAADYHLRASRVIERVGEVAYKLELPEELSRVHNTFHVSNLKKCHADEPLAVPLDGLNLDDKLHFVEEPVEIVDREVKRLKRSRIPLVKVRWNSKRGPEYTWEREDQFKKKYPHLFTKTTPSSSAAL